MPMPGLVQRQHVHTSRGAGRSNSSSSRGQQHTIRALCAVMCQAEEVGPGEPQVPSAELLWIQQQQQQRRHHQPPAARLAVIAAACVLQFACGCSAAELVESSLQAEGNVPSELSAAGEQQGPPLSSLMQGSNGKQIEGCTRRCVPTCIRGGEGSPGLGPISLRREIVVFKDGFRSRQYCLSECAQVCKLISDSEQQQQQQKQP